MADLFGDDFSSDAPPADQAVEEDPAAAFLAQQENEIAGLESEAFGMTDDITQQQQMNDYTGTNGYGEDFLQDTPPEQNQASGDDLFDVPASYEATDTFENGDDGVGEMDPSQAYAAIAAADARIQQLRAEPPKITEWREEHNKMLQEKDAEEEIKKQEWIDQARKELEDWERNRLEQLEKTKANNRIANEAFVKSLTDDKNTIGYTTAEKEFVAERDENRPGSEWERVAKLCDFNPKSSKGMKDVSRMRSTLLQLKQHNMVKPSVSK